MELVIEDVVPDRLCQVCDKISKVSRWVNKTNPGKRCIPTYFFLATNEIDKKKKTAVSFRFGYWLDWMRNPFLVSTTAKCLISLCFLLRHLYKSKRFFQIAGSLRVQLQKKLPPQSGIEFFFWVSIQMNRREKRKVSTFLTFYYLTNVSKSLKSHLV